MKRASTGAGPTKRGAPVKSPQQTTRRRRVRLAQSLLSRRNTSEAKRIKCASVIHIPREADTAEGRQYPPSQPAAAPAHARFPLNGRKLDFVLCFCAKGLREKGKGGAFGLSFVSSFPQVGDTHMFGLSGAAVGGGLAVCVATSHSKPESSQKASGYQCNCISVLGSTASPSFRSVSVFFHALLFTSRDNRDLPSCLRRAIMLSFCCMHGREERSAS